MHRTARSNRRRVCRFAGISIMVLVLGLMLTAIPASAMAAVTLDDVSPSSATQGETVDVTLEGTGFASGMTAKINKTDGEVIVNGNEISVTGDTEAVFRFTIPSGADTGTHRLTVVQDAYEDSRSFTINSIVGFVELNGDVVTSDQYTSNNNTIRIDVQANNSNAEVKFGSVCTIKADGTLVTKQSGLEAEKSGSTYTVERYPLKPGKNTVTITTSVGKKRERFRFTITYADVPSTGAEYYVGNIFDQKRIEAFSKNVTVDLGKGNYLATPSGAMAGDQSLTITVSSGTPSHEPDGFAAVSPVYKIMADNVSYRIGVPGEFTLKYSGIGTADSLTVYRADTAGFSTGLKNLGGQVNQKSGTITIPLEGAFSGYYAVFTSIVGAENYADLPLDGWYYHPVSALRAKGVMEPANSEINPWYYNGVSGPDTFGLDSTLNISRGEFAFMMVRGLGLAFVDIGGGQGTTMFSDVNSSLLTHYYRQGIETSARNGLVRGYPPDGSGNVRFGWVENLTREQAAAIIARAAGLRMETNETRARAALARLYTDADSVSSWAASSVLACSNEQLMGGVPEVIDGKTYYRFDGSAPLTRAQAASLLYRLMESEKLL